MTMNSTNASLEAQIDQWRSYLRRRQAIHSVDIAELEDHLREQVAGLTAAGLDADEAFLVAVKRMGNLDAVSREFAREHSERLWKQLVVASADPAQPGSRTSNDAVVALCLAVAAAGAIEIPTLFGIRFDSAHAGFWIRNVTLFVLPLLTAYFAWKRNLERRTITLLGVAFVAAALLANVYPFRANGSTATLTGLHLAIGLWLVVGIAYASNRWRQVAGRMDFIRFSGELFIYYALIALGGIVLTVSLLMIFEAIGLHAEWFIHSWLIPCGAAGAVLVASWLVEAKQSVIENMAPVLTRLFTPLFAALLVTFLGALLWTGRASAIQRDVLIAFDVLLVIVLGLLLYSVSARDPEAPRGLFDGMQVVLVVSALLADAVALWAIAGRITDLGFTPNRLATLGVNVILLVNLAWSAVLYVRFLRGRAPFTTIERWQTTYLPVYAVWAAIVVIVFPPAFGFI
jgi:hypothetical protein